MKQTQDIIIEDNKHYLVGIKPSGQTSQKSERGDDSLQNQIEAYRKKALHILTRLDQPVSGVVVFSKSKAFTRHFLDLQKDQKVKKTYIAYVEGHVVSKGGRLENFLVHDKKNKKARICPESTKNTEYVVLDYKVLKQLDKYTVIEVELMSGSFHQIRVQLSHMGHPIKGDVKYGARRGNKDRSIHLHAYKVAFKDLDKKNQLYTAGYPSDDTLWALMSDIDKA